MGFIRAKLFLEANFYFFSPLWDAELFDRFFLTRQMGIMSSHWKG